MPLSTQQRNSIYNKFIPMLGEEDAAALLDQYPAHELDEPVTKAFVRTELAETREALTNQISELRGRMDGLATKSELAETREALTSQISELRGRMDGLATKSELAETRGTLRNELTETREALTNQVSGLRGDIAQIREQMTGLTTKAELTEIRVEMTELRGELRNEIHKLFAQQTVWLFGSVVAAGATMAAIVGAFL